MPIVVEADVRERFQHLTNEWKAQSRYLSNTAQMAMLWPYQRIIGLGATAVPLILAELRRETDHWFWRWRQSRGRIRFLQARRPRGRGC